MNFNSTRNSHLARWQVLREPLVIFFMLATVYTVYCPPMISGRFSSLIGSDYSTLHERRIRYAREALFGPHHYLPGWYTRELMGTPFWSNIQSFPMIPTRLILLGFDPTHAYAIGVEMAALLAALLAYLYCRQIGLGSIGAAAAGFTFACAGFFAARVTVGHLPLLEAYPALPLLLWLVEKFANAQHRRGIWLLALGLASTMIALAGHPQLPGYALIMAVIYALYRMPNVSGLRAVAAITLGFGCAAVALWPMMLLARLSTHNLSLAAADNNVFFPYSRLKAFLFPWADGWPILVNRSPQIPFSGYPNESYFWDTACYVGWLPVLGAAILVIRTGIRRKLPVAPWPFIAVTGILALLLALPFSSRLVSAFVGTTFRSNSRQIYITTFAMAVAFGGAIELLLRPQNRIARRWTLLLAAILLSTQVIDVVINNSAFVNGFEFDWSAIAGKSEQIARETGDGRVGIDFTCTMPLNRQIDDVGFFDSIALAKPYTALLEVSGIDPNSNNESLKASELSDRALAFAGVKSVITYRPKPDGKMIVITRAVPHPSARIEFFPADRVQYLDPVELHRKLRDPAVNLQTALVVPGTSPSASSTQPTGTNSQPVVLQGERPTSDEIIVRFTADRGGYLRVLEAWNPGWNATVDGRPQEIAAADDSFLSVAVGPGSHTIRFTFATPGKTTGVVISLGCLILLLLLSLRRHARRSVT